MNRVRSIARTVRSLAAASAFFAFAATSQTSHAQGMMASLLSDLWWNPSESGWGVTVDQQQDVMFLTLFIEKADGAPYWVVAILSRTTPGSDIVFPASFTGDLYEQMGTYYGLPWNPAQASNRKAGTATFTATSYGTASLSYTIDGTPVQKLLVRQTLRLLNFSGVYLGGLQIKASCPNGTTSIVEPGTVNVAHAGTQITIINQSTIATCTFNGTYSQAGLLGSVMGTYSCTNGNFGDWALTAMQRTAAGFSAIHSGTAVLGGCSGYRGTIGGVLMDQDLP